MEIISGKIKRPQKVIIYGPEGIGKSTFAALFPAPLFIDIEGSTNHLNIDRIEKPMSWSSLMSCVDKLLENNMGYQTLVIDTIDWAERLAIHHVCSKANKQGIEEFGYGKGYVFLAEEVGRFLNRLSDLVDRGMNVVLCAHSQIKKFEQPDEAGSYDRYELKLERKTSPLVKEWADMLLFATYKTLVVEIDGRKKAQGGKRVIKTQHHPCWDAKNRHELPEEIPMEYKAISDHIYTDDKTKPTSQTKSKPQGTTGKPEQKPTDKQTKQQAPDQKPKSGSEQRAVRKDQYAFNTKLYQLMDQHNVTEEEIQEAVASRGYYPKNTLIHVYSEDFVNGVLISAWDQVFGLIKENRERKVVA